MGGPFAGKLRAASIIPDRYSYLRLVASPSTYLLLIALVASAVSKAQVLRGVDDVSWWPLWWLGCVAFDGLAYGAMAALLAIGERHARWLVAFTWPLAAALCFVAITNAAYLSLVGEQLTFETIDAATEHMEEVMLIAKSTLREIPATGWLLVILAIAIPPLVWALLRKTGRPIEPAGLAHSRAHSAALCAVVSLGLLILSPRAQSFAVDQLGTSAPITLYRGLIRDLSAEFEGHFNGYRPSYLLTEAQIETLSSSVRSNLVVIVLESTRRDVTSLHGGQGLAKTPHMAALAARGFEATHLRSVLPHTTKALFALLCGRLPMMQHSNYEGRGVRDLDCLPKTLAQAGYKTAFFQSAVGGFEDRPRLVNMLGYQQFAAWEDIGGEPLGYLGSDDASLTAPLRRFLDQATAQTTAEEAPPQTRLAAVDVAATNDRTPFFLTLLTSATHHPYRLPSRIAKGTEDLKNRARYALLIEDADRLVGDVVEELRTRGLLDSTIVAVVGDHGEGFGERGVRGHNDIFFDHGLLVPLVIAGPGVPHMRQDVNASGLDLVPTLLAALGAKVPAEVAAATAGRSLLGDVSPDRPLVFSCFEFDRCMGVMSGDRKIVWQPNIDHSFWFDLAADPEERDAHSLTSELEGVLASGQAEVFAHRTNVRTDRATMNSYPPWRCPAEQSCRHPRSPQNGVFYRHIPPSQELPQ